MAYSQGYTMCGPLAIALAFRHPNKTGKQVILSGTSRLDGWYPEELTVIGKLTPETFAGSPIESEYKRLSPNPKKFGAMIEKVKALDARPFGWSDEDVQRSEEHTSELQSLMRNSYAVFCLKKKRHIKNETRDSDTTKQPITHTEPQDHN